MKNLILICLILVTTYSNAQTQNEVDETQWNGIISPNLYLRDLNNNLDAFTGTYVCTSGDTIFRIKLRKILDVDTGPYNEDILIGELEFKIGNTFVINSMGDYNTAFPNQLSHHLDGGRTLNNTDKPICNNCVQNEKRLDLSINDNVFVSSFILKRTIINGYQALLAYKYTQGPYSRHAGDPPLIAKIRDGNFVFIKQP